jgi:uncharacterized pyridoxamine 5'-phosphate oxidase family protein
MKLNLEPKMGLRDEIMDVLHNTPTLVFATSSNDRVTARTVSVISDMFDVYFNTDSNFTKVQQIQDNPKVALCVGGYQFEGVAEVIGHPRENLFFYEEYRRKHPNSHEKYSTVEDEVIIKVSVSKVQVWRYIDAKPYIINYDVQTDEVKKREYVLDPSL